MNVLEKKDIIGLFESIRDKIKENKDNLIKLDSEIGDGDLGLTMDEGFSAICDNFKNLSDVSDLSIFLKKSGFAMAAAVPSTMGTLLSITIMKSGDPIKGKTTIELSDTPKMLSAGIEGMVQKGRAKKRGEKTILDALYPALEELEKAVNQNKSFQESFAAAYQGAKRGVEDTKKMKSVWGKAAVYGEQSIGKQDPGATVALYIFEGIADFFK